MIHGASTDPVFVKKIYLKIWPLKAEIEAILKKRQAESEGKITPEEIQKIAEQYRYKGEISAPANLSLVEGGAEEGVEEGEETSEENPEEVEASAEDENSEESSEETQSVEIIQRYSELIPAEKVIHGMTILAEVGLDKVHFFSHSGFMDGESIVLEFQVPKRFVVSAEISLCRPLNLKSTIISPNRLHYRVVAQFNFLRPGEKTLLRNFIKSIEPDVPEVVVKPVKAKEEDDEGFDELDGLDF